MPTETWLKLGIKPEDIKQSPKDVLAHLMQDKNNLRAGVEEKVAFTIKEESNHQFAFLYTLVSRKGNAIIIDVYRKPTHTDRYLDFFSRHDQRHKISTAETLLQHAI